MLKSPGERNIDGSIARVGQRECHPVGRLPCLNGVPPSWWSESLHAMLAMADKCEFRLPRFWQRNYQSIVIAFPIILGVVFIRP